MRFGRAHALGVHLSVAPSGGGRYSRRRSRHGRTPGRSARSRFAIGASLLLVAGLIVLIACAGWVGTRALAAKDALTSAESELTTFKSALGQPNAPSTVELYQQLSASTAKAAKETDDPIWSAFERVPFIGPNLRAFRQVSELTDTLVRQGVKPVAIAANGVSVNSLQPKNGVLDIATLKKLTPAVAQLDDALHAADASTARIDTRGLAPQLLKPITSLRATLGKVMPVTAELRKVMPVLYPALGGNGTRHYILIFQNNAEERSSGGNPAAMAMLDVSHGRIKLGKQPNSGDFPHPYKVPPLTWQGDWAHIYGLHTSAYVTNITFTPDFPQTARMARAMWRTEFGGTVDGVISFDPVALSYLMKATGPIKLPTGETLTSDNAVQFLLSGVYAKYTDPQVQNAVFASAAQAIFKAVTSGQGSPQAYVKQLPPMLNEQRLKAWSNRKNEEDLLLTSQAGNMLPADNTKATTFGVYNNDDATSKMSYYMDATADVTAKTCPAKTPTYTLSTTVTDTLKESQISGLTSYVLANQTHIPWGGDRQWVQLYGPVGSKLVSATIDGKKVVWGTDQDWHLNTVPDATGMDIGRPSVKGELYGRPVGVVSITLGPQQSVTVKATFSGATTPSSTIAVSHTPKVRPVPVTLKTQPCG